MDNVHFLAHTTSFFYYFNKIVEKGMKKVTAVRVTKQKKSIKGDICRRACLGILVARFGL